MRSRFGLLELAIFCLVSILFGKSVYNLTAEPQPSRTPSSQAEPPQVLKDKLDDDLSYSTKCRIRGETFETKLKELRITGTLCGLTEANKPLGQNVENKTNNFIATVFTERLPQAGGSAISGKFSTDFIPLEKGSNRIHLQFDYEGSPSFKSEIIVLRKDQ